MTLKSSFNYIQSKSPGTLQTINNLPDLAKGVGHEILWRLTGHPDVLLGIIPIYTAQRYEVARSHERMKYRAVAGQFFAHQRGGQVGFKVVLYLIGKESLDYLSYIQMLHILGDASYPKIEQIANNGIAGIKKLINSTTVISGKKATLSKDDMSWQTYEHHYTFTIITKEEIMHDMYIETVLYERDVTFGDAIKVTLLCRKYIKPAEIQAINLIGMDNDKVVLRNSSHVKTQTDGGCWSEDVKHIVVEYKPVDVGRQNMFGLFEQVLHRQYVNYLGDKYTDLEIGRTVGGRLNTVLYALNGKYVGTKTAGIIVKNITAGTGITTTLGDKVAFGQPGNRSDESNLNSELSNVIFASPNGTTISIDYPKKAEYLQHIVNGEKYSLNITYGQSKYYGEVMMDQNGLHSTKLSQIESSSGYTYDIDTHSYIAPEDNSFLILYFRKKDGTFDIYSYGDTFMDGDSLQADTKVLRDL